MDKSRTREEGGTGLGLSIVKHGALYHNAEIVLESNVGSGTTVTILFPSGAAKRKTPKNHKKTVAFQETERSKRPKS